MSFVIHSELLFRMCRHINIASTQAEIENRRTAEVPDMLLVIIIPANLAQHSNSRSNPSLSQAQN